MIERDGFGQPVDAVPGERVGHRSGGGRERMHLTQTKGPRRVAQMILRNYLESAWLESQTIERDGAVGT